MRILLISYYFPPSNAIGAKRADSFFNLFIKKGFHVDVISGFLDIKKNNTDIHNSRPITNFFKKLKHKLSIDLIFRSIDKSLFSRFFLSSLKKIKKLTKPHIIIVSYKPSSVIYLGIFAKIIFKAKLIVDLRDLISQIGVKNKKPVFHYLDTCLDKFLLSFADEIITVSDVCRSKSEKIYNRKVHEIQNGIDGKILNFNSTNNNNFKILYAGTFSSERTLKNTLFFLDQYNINFELLVASSMKPNNTDERITWKGYLSKLELNKLVSSSDALLLLEGMTINSFENIPAKIFDYLKFNKPILIDCNPESQVSQMITKINKGLNIHNPMSNLNLFIKNYNTTKDIEIYSREYQNNKLMRIIEKL